MDDIFDNLGPIVQPDFSPLANAPDFESAVEALRGIMREHYSSSLPAGLENCFYPAVKAGNGAAVEAVFYAAEKLSKLQGYEDVPDRLKRHWGSWILGQGLGGMVQSYIKVHHEGRAEGLWTDKHPDGRHALHAWMWMSPKSFEEAMRYLVVNNPPPAAVCFELLSDLKQNNYRAGSQLTVILKSIPIDPQAKEVDEWLKGIEEMDPAEGVVDLAVLMHRPQHALWKTDTTWSNALINRQHFPQANHHLTQMLDDEHFEKLEAFWERMGKANEFESYAIERRVQRVHENLSEQTPEAGPVFRSRRI